MAQQHSGEDAAPGLARLPPGRHGLSREFVAENQRGRLVAGTIAAVAARGYHDATITDIAAAAGVSRRTFYSYFSSKENCFLDAYEEVARHLEQAMREAGEGAGGWTEEVRRRLAALLEAFAANPDLVRFTLISPPHAGGEIARRFQLLLQRLLAALTENKPETLAKRPSKAVEEGLMGSIVALIAREARTGRCEGLPGLVPDLVELVLTPYMGREDAVRAARSS